MIGAVQWDGPAFKAGIAGGQTLVAVNGRAYEADDLRDVLKAGKGKGGGVDLLLKSGDRYRTVRVAYDGGLRYPHLVKDGAGPAALERIAAARD